MNSGSVPSPLDQDVNITHKEILANIDEVSGAMVRREMWIESIPISAASNRLGGLVPFPTPGPAGPGGPGGPGSSLPGRPVRASLISCCNRASCSRGFVDADVNC
jgi:hypothetical protein